MKVQKKFWIFGQSCYIFPFLRKIHLYFGLYNLKELFHILDLLRRLSRSQNTVFCGRILLFLAKFFPVSERSGLNVVSEFNLENTTVFSTTDETTDANGDKDDPMEIDLTKEDDIKVEEDQRSLSVDYALYAKFWQLQDFFRNPNQCYNNVKWKTFSTVRNHCIGA